MFELMRPPTGQVLDRRTRLVHNGRWHLLDDGRHVKVGWGDLSLAGLTAIRTRLGRGLFLAVREEADLPPDGSAWWGDYDRLDDGPLPVGAKQVARQTLYAVSGKGGVMARVDGERCMPAAMPGRARVRQVRVVSTRELSHIIAAHGVALLDDGLM